jgi:hypothetical protein
LICAHAFLGLAEQVNAEKPLPQGKVGIVEDCSSCYAELVAAMVAIKLVALYDLRNLVGRATRAHNGIRPAQRLKVLAALVLAAKLLNQSAKINRGLHA